MLCFHRRQLVSLFVCLWFVKRIKEKLLNRF